jgi:hypothetical protein
MAVLPSQADHPEKGIEEGAGGRQGKVLPVRDCRGQGQAQGIAEPVPPAFPRLKMKEGTPDTIPVLPEQLPTDQGGQAPGGHVFPRLVNEVLRKEGLKEVMGQ